MFSGIVEEMGMVVRAGGGGLTVRADRALEGVRLGDSVSVNGACLTVVAMEDGVFSVDLSPETIARTNLGELKEGDRVDIERALALGQRMGGHMVQGHVDGTGVVKSLMPQENGCVLMTFDAPRKIMRYVVEKGFVAVEGVSLTVVERKVSSFSVSVIPYTSHNTVLGLRRPGDRVNLEVDVLAKYVEQAAANYIGRAVGRRRAR